MHSSVASWGETAAAAPHASVCYHESVSKLQAPHLAALDRLATGPFDSTDWYRLLEDHGGAPLLAMAEGHSGVAALPLTQRGRKLESLHHFFAFTWRPLAPEGPAGDTLLADIARDLRTRTHWVALECLPGEDGSAQRLDRAFRKAGWLTNLSICDTNHVLDVRGRSFAEYWAGRPGQMRSTLKRKAKKVEVSIATAFDPSDWDAYRAIYARSWKSEERDAALLESFARAEGAAGRLRMGIARHDGEPVAAQFWSVEGGTAYIHKLAYDSEHRHLSAGTTLSAALFEHVIDQDRVDLVDFGTGSDEYKRDWMDTERPRYALTCIDWRQPRGVALLVAKAVGKAAALLGATPSGPLASRNSRG
ncbi:MAG: GNAT family N-acetyltransferase [Erythrobacter sp.]|nr:GNAT family N-acetyltransferase [Erythrobacter sp.]